LACRAERKSNGGFLFNDLTDSAPHHGDSLQHILRQTSVNAPAGALIHTSADIPFACRGLPTFFAAGY